MPDRISKVQRWLDLISFLAARHQPVPAEALWRSVPAYARALRPGGRGKETLRRMFERDKDELRDFGVPIELVPLPVPAASGATHGYRMTTRDFHLPYLRLMREAEGGIGRSGLSRPGAFEVRSEEAAAVLGGLHTLARAPGFPLAPAAFSAFRKLSFDLDPAFVEEPPITQLKDPEVVRTAEALAVLGQAVLRRKSVSFDYLSMDRGEVSTRQVHPWGLAFQRGRWYLAGWDRDRADVRVFRLGRMDRVTAHRSSPGTPDFEIPSDFDLRRRLRRWAWELGEDAEVAIRVRFRYPRSAWAERNEVGVAVGETGAIEAGAEGSAGATPASTLREFRVRRLEPFLRWVVSMAPNARVESPAEAREAFAELVRDAAALHPGGA